MQAIMTALLMIFLISCTASCKKKIICKEIKRAEIKPLVWCDISFSPEARCRCRCFDMNRNKTVADNKCDTEDLEFTSGNYPIQECNDIAGPTKQDWATQVRPNLKRLNSIKDNNCK